MKNNLTNDNAKTFMMWLAILTSFIMFVALSSILFLVNIDFILPPTFLFSTMVLLLSSISLHISNVSLKHLNFQKQKKYLWITIILGLLFLLLQVQAWLEMIDYGLLISTGKMGIVYILTGLHFLHILAGIALHLYTLISLNGTPGQVIKMRTKIGTIFWHFLDFLWLYLYLFMLLIF